MSSEERAEERWENEGGATASWLPDGWGGLSGLMKGNSFVATTTK